MIVSKYLLYLLLFCLSDCTNVVVSSEVKGPQNRVELDNLNLAAKKDDSPVKAVGTYMSVKTDGEHATGYSVELWTNNDQIYGLVSVHRGLMGDPPAGILENAKFDNKTGKISFRAKLTLGQFYDKDKSTLVPSRDVLDFEGTLTNRNLSGRVQMTNQLCPDGCPERKKINLPYSKEWSEGMKQFKDYSEWKSFANEILNHRGPSW